MIPLKTIIQQDVKVLDGWESETDVLSIYAAMQQLNDKRRKQGKRYPLELVLTYILLAKAAGETTLQAIAEWIRLRGSWLQTILPGVRETFPCPATYSNVLRAVDPEEVNQALMSLLTRARARNRKPGEQEHVALDGKTLRGTQHHLPEDQKKMHQVNLYETQTGLVLKEQIVGDKENELSRIQEVLTPQLLKGRIVSADALHTQKAFCLSTILAGGEYLLIAKGNHPTLLSDLQLFFTEPPLDCQDWRMACQTNKGHGRLEERFLMASTELNDFLAKEWPGIGQVFGLRRRVQKALFCTQEWVYGITSLSPSQADPHRLLSLLRAHWAIENRLHWRRDVTMREDACQVRKGCAPRTLAVLNSFLLALFDWLEVGNVASQMRLFSAQPFLALSLLVRPLLREN
jgi:predicted transposase YbfD/YdcC